MRPIRFFVRASLMMLATTISVGQAAAPIAQAAVVVPQVVATPAASPRAVVRPRATPAAMLPAGLASTTPVIAQGDYLDGFACAPTSLAMVLAYYHATLGTAAATPQQLVEPGDYLPGQGVPYDNMVNTLQSLGYNHLSGHQGATLDELVRNLTDGPVIVTMRVANTGATLVPGTISHSVVVVGVAADRSAVLINDPWTARQLRLSMSQFTAMWAGNDNAIVLIRP